MTDDRRELIRDASKKVTEQYDEVFRKLSDKQRRDLSADLRICEEAPEGLYGVDVPSGLYVIEADGDVFAECYRALDARFIAESREGWEHAIRRAMDAEKEVEELRKEIEFYRMQRETLENQIAHYRGYGE